MTKGYAIAAAALFATAPFSSQTQASIVLGNLNETTPGTPLLFGSTTSITNSQAKAVTFTVAASTRLGSAFLALSNFDNLDLFSIFIGSFAGNTITPLATLALTAPERTTSNNAQVWRFDYLGTPDFFLTPGITYALTLTGGGTGSYTWGQVGSPGVTPSGTATFGGYYFSDNAGASYSITTDPDLKNSFSIDDTGVPVPAPVALLLPALAWLARRRPGRG